MMRIFRTFLLVASVFVGAAFASGQELDDSALSGAYNFVDLRAQVTAAGVAENVWNLGGTITFDGTGGYSYEGRQGEGTGSAAAVSGSGAYAVSGGGFVTLSHPALPDLSVNARLGADASMAIGGATEDRQWRTFFAAVRAPAGDADAGDLNGEYSASYLNFPDGQDIAVSTALASFTANGQGGLGNMVVDGHARDQGDVHQRQTAAGGSYTLAPDGTGAFDPGSGASLFVGSKEIFISADRAVLLGFSTGPGERDIMVAVRRPAQADNASFNGTYWLVDLFFQAEDMSYQSNVGGLRVDGAGRGALAQRLNLTEAAEAVDLSLVAAYSIGTDGTGFFGPFVIDEVTNLALGNGPDAVAPLFLGASVDQDLPSFSTHGISIGVRAPEFTGEGVFIQPLGVLNAASLAPATNPIAPGTLVSIFGSELADSTAEAQAVPLPTTLDGVSVTIDGAPAPLFFVSPSQINVQTPFAAAGAEAAVVVNNNGRESNAVAVPLAATSPGIFSVDQNGIGPGIITHPDFSLVTEANPAAPGEIVIIFLTGLGVTTPPFGDGEPGPSDPLSTVPTPGVLFDNEDGEILFAGAAPNFVGLYQINVRLPVSVFGGIVGVAISTNNAFSDMVDLPVAF